MDIEVMTNCATLSLTFVLTMEGKNTLVNLIISALEVVPVLGIRTNLSNGTNGTFKQVKIGAHLVTTRVKAFKVTITGVIFTYTLRTPPVLLRKNVPKSRPASVPVIVRRSF